MLSAMSVVQVCRLSASARRGCERGGCDRFAKGRQASVALQRGLSPLQPCGIVAPCVARPMLGIVDRVFVIGEKQGSYSFSGEPYASFGFTEGMVWDFNDVCARIMSLKIEALTDLAEYVTRESRRVRIELEIPDEQGNFSTSINHPIEALPQPKLSDAAKLAEHFHSDNPKIDRSELEGAIKQLSHRLARLPRLTREVFKLLVERRDEHTVGTCEHFRISDPLLRRIYRGDDLDGDLSLLTEARLVSFDEPDEGGQPYYWTLHFPAADTGFHLLFVEYANSRNLGLHKPLVALDFSDF